VDERKERDLAFAADHVVDGRALLEGFARQRRGVLAARDDDAVGEPLPDPLEQRPVAHPLLREHEGHAEDPRVGVDAGEDVGLREPLVAEAAAR
jgi:hypothetical protein